MRAGTAVRDITPDVPVAMSGFVARRTPATGVHDPLLLQALVVDDTALVTVDVVGLHEADCAEIRRRCPLPAENVVVHATHTHAGPVSMRGRLGQGLAEDWLAGVVDAAVACVAEASAAAVEVSVRAGYGAAPGVARNRRRPDGPVDDQLPVLHLLGEHGPVAAVVSYACHPVVLGADNTSLSADYPGVVRRELRRALGAPVLFVTGCAGDANTGHRAEASISTDPSPDRSFPACEEVGRRIAAAAAGGPLTPAAPERLGDPARVDRHLPTARAARRELTLRTAPTSPGRLAADLRRWEAELADAPPARAALLQHWVAWARSQPTGPPAQVSVTCLRWGDAVLLALPGEPFAVAAHALRAEAATVLPGATVVVAGYANGCPGYLPDRAEYGRGGYEVCDAHRYYGMPGPFEPGSLETVLDAAREALAAVR